MGALASEAHGSSRYPPQLAVLLTDFGDGGVERMLVNIARGLTECNIRVDFLVKQANLPYLSTLPSRVRLIELQADREGGLLGALVAYLRTNAPEILLSAKSADDRLAVKARSAAGVATRVALRTGTNLSARLAVRGKNPLRRWLERYRVRRLYTQADCVICVSHGVADDLARITGLARQAIHVPHNPVVTPELLALAQASAPHPWLAEQRQWPVVLGAGGLRRQKNFPLLLRAFASLRRQRPCRLIILGEGRQRARLGRLAERLGITEDVSLPGFVDNPYAYMARAALFVLSSHWEGSPNVLTEAMAVGTPVVATDCPSGPREILDGGRYGELVDVDDPIALARAMDRTLTSPPSAERLRQAVRRYTLAHSSREYLDALGLRHA
ncbi:glycosyltransferase [Nitrococcus mobilis]|uniref:Glycosyl transferase, group 1 family protein n=1 Tax=Nitrococcus mobilis Nb-231 TaxID=314278 RepID=A4BL88_9GAMM|nr:glycosyltransferase [Nitrococcus mobilis]EAR23076.1 glycosyl transferase, group 1 family protein [Nitrococcus mobilis Nb-231]